jgi:rod shape-determining protein MreD
MGGSWARNALKVLALLVVGILAQTTFANDLRVHNVAPDFMMLLAVSAGFTGGPDQGAVVGFTAGLMSDLFLQSTPFGLSALAGCLVGFGVGWVSASLLRPRLLFAPAVAAVGTAVGVVLFVVIGYVVGQAQLVAPGEGWLAGVAVIEACYSVVLALPVTALMAWALGAPNRSPTSMGQGPPSAVADLAGHRHQPTTRSRRRRRARAGVR